MGDVRTNLTGDDRENAAIGPLSPGLRANHRECSGTDRATHIEFPAPDREVRAGMIDESPDLSLGVRLDQNAPQRTVAKKLERKSFILVQHAAKQQTSSEGPPQGCARRRRGLMTCPRFVNQPSRDRSQSTNRFVRSSGFYQ